MNRLAFRLSAAIIMLLAGVGFHLLTLKVVSIIVTRSELAALDSAFAQVKFEPEEELESPLVDPCTIVVCAVKDRALFLGKGYAGQLGDYTELTARLGAMLRQKRRGCITDSLEIEQRPFWLQPRKSDCCDSIVYIKAITTLPYGDVVKLVEIVKAAGASRVGLVASKS